MKIEFYHDVICSFCFPMSYRMRKLAKKYPKLEVTHRSFALAWEEEQMNEMFGSHEKAKAEVLTHWAQANQQDELKRFNIPGMKNQDFLFPTSKNPLIAAKAAGIVGGQTVYWEVFDALQSALFEESRDVSNIEVIEEIIQTTSVDFENWKETFEDADTEQATLEDMIRAQQFGLQGVPALVIEEKYLISGAQAPEIIEQTLEAIAEEEHLSLT